MKPWAIAILLASTVSASAGSAADIDFEVVDAGKTGIRAIFEKWHADEMRRQGGPGKSHGWWPWGLRAFDIDNDGDLDLVASHHGVPRSLILKSLLKETGAIRFVDATRDLGVDSRDLPGADDRPWIWDFDGDGWLDLAGFSDESPPPSVWNQAGKRLVPTGKPLFRTLSHPREVIDLNGDGHPDLDGGSKGRWLYVPDERTFRHDPTPRFGVPPGLPADLRESVEARGKASRFYHVDYLTHAYLGHDTLGYDPRPIDLNGDGRPDVVVHGSGGYGAEYLGRYLLRAGDGSLADRTRELGLPPAGAPILIDDLSGDGRPDILIAGEKDSGLYVNGGEGKFLRRDNALTAFLTRRGPYLLRAFRVDLDNDGDWDLVVSSPRLGREAVFENRGGGDFAQVLLATGWDSNPVVLADLDADGRMDLAIGGPGKAPSKEITLYLNRTAHAGNWCKIHPRMPAPNPYAVGAVVEVYRAGELDGKPARPILVEKAHPDATPVHVGLGKADACDIRVTYPGGKVVTGRGIRANSRVTADAESGAVRPR